MNMGRRRNSSADSLELLLDTICNTFGGVLFIAILVVILLQTTGDGTADPMDSAREVRIQELTARLEEDSAKLEAIEQADTGQRQLIEQFSNDDVRELLHTRDMLRESSDQARRERDDLIGAAARDQAAINAARRDTEDVKPLLPGARRQVQELERQLESERASRREEIRLPVAHPAAGKTEIGLILRYGRMYVWHTYDRFGNREGLNLEDFAIVDANASTIVARPKPTAGIKLDDSPETRASIARKLRMFSPSNCVLAIVVRPDSYEAFRFVRGAAVATGFEYRLIPLNETGAIQDRGGVGERVQ